MTFLVVVDFIASAAVLLAAGGMVIASLSNLRLRALVRTLHKGLGGARVDLERTVGEMERMAAALVVIGEAVTNLGEPSPRRVWIANVVTVGLGVAVPDSEIAALVETAKKRLARERTEEQYVGTT
jgi:hypothetical protein